MVPLTIVHPGILSVIVFGPSGSSLEGLLIVMAAGNCPTTLPHHKHTMHTTSSDDRMITNEEMLCGLPANLAS